MTISADTSIILDVHSPKKDATIGEGTPDLALLPNSVAIWANGIAKPEFTTQTIASWWDIYSAVADESKRGGAGILIASSTIDAAESEVDFGPPVTGSIGLYVGADVHSNARTHFLDRTLKRLCERWLELAKTGSGIAPAARAKISALGINSWDFGGQFWSGDDVGVQLKIADPDGLEEDDSLLLELPPLPGNNTIYNPEMVAQMVCDMIAGLVHYRCARTGTVIEIGPAAPANSVLSNLTAILQ